MGNDSKKPGSNEAKFTFDLEPEENDRPTVAPPFDVAEFAKEAGTAQSPRILPAESLPPDSYEEYASRPPRERLETLTNEVELELARLRSAQTVTVPPPADLQSSLLSLADGRTASIFPDRPPPNESFVPFDRNWEEETPTAEAPSAPRMPSIPDAIESGAQTVRGSTPAYARAAASVRAGATSNRAAAPQHLITPLGMAAPIALEMDDPSVAEDPLFSPAPSESPPPPRSATRQTPPGIAKSASASPMTAAESPLIEMRERFSLGDYSGALVVAEGLLEDDPKNPELNETADNCRAVLRQMYTARIGPLDRVPVVVVARDQLRWLSIDHRAGFVLSHVDGVSSLEMILDVSGMPTLDTLRILCELSQQRIISFR